MAQFANDLLAIGNGATVRQSPTLKQDVAPWAYSHLPDNILDALIDAGYPNLDSPNNPFDKEYLAERAILSITNKDVARINNKNFALDAW
jgi:hypothetical protein